MKIFTNKRPVFGLFDTILLIIIIIIIVSFIIRGEEKKIVHSKPKIEFNFNEGVEDLSTSVQYKWYNQAVTAYKSQMREMVARWYSATRILDLLAIKSMECNRFDWLCKWIDRKSWNLIDIWPFQINNIHREHFKESVRLFDLDDRAWLFLYQLSYANQLVQSYEDRFCGEHIFKQIGRTFTNERRFKCNAVSYNWHPTWKQIFSELWWEKRKIISQWLVENSNFVEAFNINK